MSNSTRTRTHGPVPAPVRAATKRVPKKAPAPRARTAARPPAPAVKPMKALKPAKAVKKASRPTGLRVAFRAGNPRGRMLFVLGLTAVIFVAIVGRVVFLQTVGSDTLVAAGRAQRVSESVLHAQRGTIFARDGGELAISVPSSSIFINPQLISAPEATVAMLTATLGLDSAKQAKLLAAMKAKDKSFVYVARQVDDQTADAVMALNLAGVDRLREDKRTMPSGEVGRSVLGRTDVDGKGTAGLEMQFNTLLTGTDGERVREHDSKGRSIPGSDATTIQPVPGQDLVLTLDRSLQFQVEQGLLTRVDEVKAKGGTVIVMDTATGEIYAMANVERDTKDNTVKVTSANLAAVEAFEPGSVAKVFSLSAVVDAGAATPETVIDVPGKMVFDQGTKWEKTINDAEPHGTVPMSMRDILVHSSNLGTYKLAKEVGNTTLAKYLDLFGFGHKTALNFPGETNGIIDSPDNWQGTEAVTVTYGYHYQASALQFAAAVNAVANKGTFVEPKLLKATIGADGTVKETAASASHKVISPASAAAMSSMMQGVVCEGTGKDARVPGMPVAGKTGTAYKVQKGTYGDKNNRLYRASFVGFFPAAAPKVTILVTIDEPDPTSADRFGGKAAAPLFAKLATAAIHELAIMPPAGDTGCSAGG